jgi:DNA-binding NarL/FixJ family response regulator
VTDLICHVSLQIIRKLLSKLGFKKIEIVDNGRKAYEEVRDKSFDIVLMDIMAIESFLYLLIYLLIYLDARDGRN